MHAHIYYNREGHVSRLLTGFHLLEKEGVLDCTLTENVNQMRPTLHSQIVEAHIDGKIIVFDMCDAFALNNENGRAYLAGVDLYFKRSYSREIDAGLTEEELAKIRPFGFDYLVTYPGNPIDTQPASVSSRAKQLLRQISGYEKSSYVDFFERPADRNDGKMKIIFMTRLWDPSEISLAGDLDPELRRYREYMIEERKKINRDRICIVRELRRIYGNAFAGGIQESPFAVRECPDLIIPKQLTRRKTYLLKMQSSDICIGSMGLHKSIGWKTGEYVAASRAIVAERFVYSVPGDFEEGKNYIPFDSAEECLTAVDRLCHSPEQVYAMKKANEQYYREYLRPEKQILNALRQCISI